MLYKIKIISTLKKKLNTKWKLFRAPVRGYLRPW
jgi:hypothetical protein